MKKKNIAICLYGQVRYVKSLVKYYEYVVKELSEYNVHLFISTWNDFDTDSLKLDFKVAKYHPTSVSLRWQTGNTQKMSYLLTDVLSNMFKYQKHNNNVEYSYIIPIRPDIVFDTDEMNNKLKSKPINNTVTVLEQKAKKGENPLTADYIFIETPDVVKQHSKIYEFFYINKQQEKSNKPYKEGGHWNHMYLFEHFDINVEYCPLATFMIRPFRDLSTLSQYLDKPDKTDNLISKLSANAVTYKFVDNNYITKDGYIYPLKSRILNE